MLNYYSIILLGTLKIRTNLLQLAIKISWNIPVCSPFILQQQHLGSESYTSTWLYPHAREASTNGTIQEGWQGEIGVALPALLQRGFSPNKHRWWWQPVFHSFQYEMANLSTICQKFKVLLINLEIQCSHNVIKANVT